jgi:hypothetical protein
MRSCETKTAKSISGDITKTWDSEFLEHIASAKELAEIMFDDNKQQILEFDTGHWAVSARGIRRSCKFRPITVGRNRDRK